MHPNSTDAKAGEAVLTLAVEVATAMLDERLLAAYALGSLAHGGFSALVSDVDLGLILRDPLKDSDEAMVSQVAASARAGGSELHDRLSVYWGTPSTLGGHVPGGRFPALDQLDLIEQGRLLMGQDLRGVVARPSQEQLLIAGAEFALDYLGATPMTGRPAHRGLGSMAPADDSVLAQIHSPALLVSKGPRRLTKIVLFPVRFLFTAATGEVGTNALAVEHYLAQGGVPASELVGAALGWRLAPPQDADAAAALLGRDLIPLYLYYIDDHIPRLLAAGRRDLGEKFQDWRRRLA